jgi:hypothetical protein
VKIPPALSKFKIMDSNVQRGMIPFIIGRLGNKLITETEIKMKLSENEFLFDEVLPQPANVQTLAVERRTFNEKELYNFLKLWKKNSVLLKFRYHERHYKRKEVEEYLQNCHPLRVDIPLGIRPEVEPGPDEEVDDEPAPILEKERDIEILWRWVLTDPTKFDMVPRALIRDDLAFLVENEAVHTVQRLIVVTDDIKMVNRLSAIRSMNWRDHRETFHCPIKYWVMCDLTPPPGFDSINEVIIDEGGLDGWIATAADEDLDPIQRGLDLSMIRLVRPTMGAIIQEEEEFKTYVRILENLDIPDDDIPEE